MSTRGLKNEDVGREECGRFARILRGEGSILKHDRGYVEWRIIGWLEAISEGGDPAEVIFGGKPYANNVASLGITTFIQLLIDHHGCSQGEAIRRAAEMEGPDWSVPRTKQIFLRHRDKVLEENNSEYLTMAVLVQLELNKGLSQEEAISHVKETYGPGTRVEQIYLEFKDQIDEEDPWSSLPIH